MINPGADNYQNYPVMAGPSAGFDSALLIYQEAGGGVQAIEPTADLAVYGPGACESQSWCTPTERDGLGDLNLSATYTLQPEDFGGI